MLRGWNPNIIRYFLDRGADFVKDSPFTIAFGERIRTTLGAWRRCRQEHPECGPQLQEQADRALRYFCLKGDQKWVSLMIWAGANPRSVGPTLDEDEDDEEYLSALTAAAYAKNAQILKLLKPDANTDDISGLLEFAAQLTHREVLQYLFELGTTQRQI